MRDLPDGGIFCRSALAKSGPGLGNDGVAVSPVGTYNSCVVGTTKLLERFRGDVLYDQIKCRHSTGEWFLVTPEVLRYTSRGTTMASSYVEGAKNPKPQYCSLR